jgi:hypothetical protein
VKKIFLLVLAAVGGVLVYRRVQAAQAEEDLWIEATSSEPINT